MQLQLSAYTLSYQLAGDDKTCELLARDLETATKELLRDVPTAKCIRMVKKRLVTF